MPVNGLDEFISKVAAAVPLPGGGSVAALAGAFAAALGEMMAGLTEGRARFASAQSEVAGIHVKLSGLRAELRALIQEDEEAYQALLDAMRMPRDTEKQRLKRDESLQQAVMGATETPLRTARAVCEVLACLKVLVEIGNPSARSDAAVGAQLAYASLKGAQYNILANIRMLQNATFAHSCRTEIVELLARGRADQGHIEAMIEAQ